MPACQSAGHSRYHNHMTFEAALKAEARSLGFALVGIARAGEADDFPRLQDWLARGYAGSMAYMQTHAAARRHPESILPDVQSVVMVGMEYGAGRSQESGVGGQRSDRAAKIARYARGPDYHGVLRAKL